MDLVREYLEDPVQSGLLASWWFLSRAAFWIPPNLALLQGQTEETEAVITLPVVDFAEAAAEGLASDWPLTRGLLHAGSRTCGAELHILSDRRKGMACKRGSADACREADVLLCAPWRMAVPEAKRQTNAQRRPPGRRYLSPN